MSFVVSWRVVGGKILVLVLDADFFWGVVSSRMFRGRVMVVVVKRGEREGGGGGSGMGMGLMHVVIIMESLDGGGVWDCYITLSSTTSTSISIPSIPSSGILKILLPHSLPQLHLSLSPSKRSSPPVVTGHLKNNPLIFA